jgi:hypothetical protein
MKTSKLKMNKLKEAIKVPRRPPSKMRIIAKRCLTTVCLPTHRQESSIKLREYKGLKEELEKLKYGNREVETILIGLDARDEHAKALLIGNYIKVVGSDQGPQKAHAQGEL